MYDSSKTYKGLITHNNKMLYCQEVIDVCKQSLHPITVRTIARKLNISRKVARASLVHAKNQRDSGLEVHLRSPLNVSKKRPIWSYKPTDA
jgi:hypothetical protein